MLACSLLLLGSLACMAAAHPIQSEMEHEWRLARERRSPMAARTMILVRGQPSNAGYHYERPDRTFNPRAAMAAYATGGTVAAGSYYGAPSQKQKCGDCKEQPEAPQPEEEDTKSVEPPAPEEAPEEVEEKEVVPERKPKAPKAPKVPSKRPPVKEDEDEDEDEEDDGSVYRNFFPMMFGGGGSRGRLRAADDEEGADGSRGPVTAIANSFSQGRGAIASSSAVAHGRPDAAQQKPSQQSRYRARA